MSKVKQNFKMLSKSLANIRDRLWRKNKPADNDSAENQSAPAAPVAAPRQPGLDCPQCGFRITIQINSLLSMQPIICPACALKISIDKEASHACLDKLKTVQHAIDNAQSVAQQK